MGKLMKEERAIERILETENLTDGFEDADADWLIKWGISFVHGLLDGIDDDEIASEKISDLMAVMRKLNQIAADRLVKPAEGLAEDVEALADRYARAFGRARTLNAGDAQRAATAIRQKTPRETVQFLIVLMSPDTPAAWSVPGDPDRKNSPLII
jgi:hypothetical protein